MGPWGRFPISCRDMPSAHNNACPSDGQAERRPAVAVDEKLAEALRQCAADGRLPCAAAFALARELEVPPLAVGQAADELGIRIADCQLGCFGKHKTPRTQHPRAC